MTNIATTLNDKELDKIGQMAYMYYKQDDDSRAEWMENTKDYIDMAMQKVEQKNYPWPNAANVKYPILLTAAIQFHARAYPSLVPGKNIVKCTIPGYDHDGSKTLRGERVSKHMSYQLMEEMDEWEPDMDRGLLVLPIVGCFFKKSYFDSMLGRNVSKIVWAQDLVVDYETKDFNKATRVTEEFTLTPQLIIERINAGTWLDIDIDFIDLEAEEPEEFIEQHTLLDLDDDGYKEPYIVTVHKSSGKVVRIVARYDDESLFFISPDGLISVQEDMDAVEAKNQAIMEKNRESQAIATQAYKELGDTSTPSYIPPVEPTDYSLKQLVRIEPIQYYTKYSFIPSPNGGVYDIGFGQLIGLLSDIINTNINHMLDASSLANLQGGFRARSTKVPAGDEALKPGEYMPIETNGMSLRDSLIPHNFRGPTPTSFNLLGLLIDSAKDIASVKDILMGDSSEGETATTTMIKREEGLKVFTAIYKRIFRAMTAEFAKLYKLNRKYLPEESYFQVLDDQGAIKRADYNNDTTDIKPQADPTIASASQRLLKAEALMAFANDPSFNGHEIKRRYVEAMDVHDIDSVIPKDPPPPMPSPEVIEAQGNMVKQQAEVKKIHEEIIKLRADTIKSLADAESKEEGIQLDKYKAQLEELKIMTAGEGSNGGTTDNGQAKGVETQSSDTAGVQDVEGIAGGKEDTGGIGPMPGRQKQL